MSISPTRVRAGAIALAAADLLGGNGATHTAHHRAE
jgi:hypothetical protein